MRSRLMHTPVFSLPADCPPLCRWFCAPRRFAGRGIFLVVREVPAPTVTLAARA